MEHHHRGERIFQTQRLKFNRQSYWSRETPDPKFLGKVVQYAQVCSCCMCGNSRKFYKNGKAGLSLKELSDCEMIFKHLI